MISQLYWKLRQYFAKPPFVFLLVILALIYGVTNFLPPVRGSNGLISFLTSYGLQSLLWGALAYYLWRLGPLRAFAKRRMMPLVRMLAIICGGLGVIVAFVAGMVYGFGKNPTSTHLEGILINMVFVGTNLLGVELSRARMINMTKRKKAVPTVIFLSLFYAALSLPPSRFTGLNQGSSLVQFLGDTIFVQVGQNALAGYLAFLGGALPAIIYRGLLLAFQWFSPILPKLPWAIQTLVGIFVPVLSLNIVHSIFRSETHQSNRGQQESPAGWIGTGLVCILSVWFASGVFTYYPSIIVTGSMTPTIDVGDMVIAKKVDARAVRVGDIVQYRRDKMVINHRVIDIQNTDNGEVFTTKGDANPSADPPVTSKQIIGKDVLTIPKIGLLSMFLRGELGPESQQRYEIPGTASP